MLITSNPYLSHFESFYIHNKYIALIFHYLSIYRLYTNRSTFCMQNNVIYKVPTFKSDSLKNFLLWEQI